MNGYTFDRTIYDGRVSWDFYRFCVKKQPALLRHLPKQLFGALRYALGLIGRAAFTETFFCFLQEVPDADALVRLFWETHRSRICEWYLTRKKADDLIVSASPAFLIRPICLALGVENLAAPEIGKTSGRFVDAEPAGAQARQSFSAAALDTFYSASLSDEPLAKSAKQSFFVKNGAAVPWETYRPTVWERAKRFFLSREFFWFLIIGVVNTFNGVFFAYLFSLLFQPNLAFVCGYLVSLSISYLLNSFITFRERLGFAKYVKFCVSYIPNFLIQNLFVLIVYNWMGLDKLIAYCAAAIIGIPVTFAMLKVFAFRKRRMPKEQ